MLGKDTITGHSFFYIKNDQPVDQHISLVSIQSDFENSITLFCDSMETSIKSYQRGLHFLADIIVPSNKRVKVEFLTTSKSITPIYLVKTDNYDTATSYTNFLIWMIIGGYLFYVIIIGSFSLFSSNKLFLYHVVFEIVTFVLLISQFNVFYLLNINFFYNSLIKYGLFFLYWILQLLLIDKLINISSLYPKIKKFVLYPFWIVLSLCVISLTLEFSSQLNYFVLFLWITYGVLSVSFLFYILYKTRRIENIYLILGLVMHFIVVLLVFDSTIVSLFNLPLNFYFFKHLLVPISKWSLFLLAANILTLSFLIFISFSTVIKKFSYTQSEVNKLYFKSINAIIDGEDQEKRKIKGYFESNFIQSIERQQQEIERLLTNKEDLMVQNIIKDLAFLQTSVKGITHKTTFLDTEMTIKEMVEELVKMFNPNFKINIRIEKQYENKIIKGDALVNLFRIIQEVFQNILKHSEAEEIWIHIDRVKKSMYIKIIDDGKGYDVMKVGKDSGIGLKNIAFRVETLKGKFKIEKLHKGTKFELILPI